MPVLVPQVKQFLDILSDIMLSQVIQMQPDNPNIEIDYVSSRLLFKVPQSENEMNQLMSAFHTPLLFSMLPDVNTLLEIIQCIVLERSLIIVGPKAKQNTNQDLQIALISSIVNSLRQVIYPLKWVQTCISIVPYDLLDILDAPMPYIVGVLNNHWEGYKSQFFGDFDSEFLSEKCLVEI